jgi:Domain of unknown function (DUF4105)
LKKKQNNQKFSPKRKSGYAGLMFKGGVLLFLLLAWIWGSLAIFFSSPGPEWLKVGLACLFATLLPALFLFSRSFIKGLVICLLIFTVLMGWWQTLQPTNEKEWAADVARVAHGEIHDNQLTLHNVRNFRYSADKTIDENWTTEARWETRQYNLDEIQGLDIFLSYWASEHIAHTIMSWDFGQDRHLAISIETRKDTSQEYSAIKGFFKQFELSYIAADERDLIRLRTNLRKERVYAYRLLTTNEQARALLENYISEMNRLASEPEFYHALTRNCTTTIQLHRNAIAPDDPMPLDWRIIASGHIDELLYEKGKVSQKLPFAELRQQSRIDQRMQAHGEEHFSRILRYDLPKP